MTMVATPFVVLLIVIMFLVVLVPMILLDLLTDFAKAAIR